MVEKNMERFIYSTNNNGPMPGLLPLLVLLFLLFRSFVAHAGCGCHTGERCGQPSVLEQEKAHSVVDLEPLDAKRYWLARDAAGRRVLLCSERLYLRTPWYETQDVMSEVASPLNSAKSTMLKPGTICWYGPSGVALAENEMGDLVLFPKTRRLPETIVEKPYILGHLDGQTIMVA
jgi:hypothetical protein